MLFLTYGKKKGTDIFSCFSKGAKESVYTLFNILPSILMFSVCISMLKTSSFFDILENLLKPVLSGIGVDTAVIPLALIRPFSGSGALACLSDILKSFKPDTGAFKTACLMMGCTETTFYTISVYFASTKATDLRHTVKAALAADIAGMVSAVIFSRLL